MGDEDVDEKEPKKDTSGLLIVQGGSINDYFKMKMKALKERQAQQNGQNGVKLETNEEVEKDESEAVNEIKSEIADPEEIDSSHKKSKKKKKKAKEAKEEPSETVKEETVCLKIKSESSGTKFVESGSITDYFAMKMKAKKEREAQKNAQNEDKLEAKIGEQDDSTVIGSGHKKSKKKKKKSKETSEIVEEDKATELNEVVIAPLASSSGSNSGMSYNKWELTNFGSDKRNEKFRRLMGIKDGSGKCDSEASEAKPNPIEDVESPTDKKSKKKKKRDKVDAKPESQIPDDGQKSKKKKKESSMDTTGAKDESPEITEEVAEDVSSSSKKSKKKKKKESSVDNTDLNQEDVFDGKESKDKRIK